MKLRNIVIVTFAAVGLFATGAWAQSQEGGAGDAPFGVNAQQNAKGAKISGPFYVELLDLTGGGGLPLRADGGARAAVRLRRNNAITTEYLELPGPILLESADDISDLTDDLLAVLATLILDAPLFPDGCDGCTVELKQAEEFEFINVSLGDGTISRIVLLDVTLAVE